jgi:predicted dehydrogenase
MSTINRRNFLGKSAAATSSFMIASRHVLGGGGRTAPSDKLNVAGIGIGGMGAADLKDIAQTENIVALCDVDWDYAAKIFAAYPKARQYKDFREMLEKQKEIDAVVVATPDNTHAVASMAALKAGKHVYCEKPLTHTVKEARLLREAALKAGVATQMGCQGHASESIRLLCEWIWDGAIGPVREVHAWTPHPVWPQGLFRPPETPPVPSTLDWDLWLGPAPYRPYHPAYLPGMWRGWWDFGTGGLGDMGCHVLDHVFWSLRLGAPASVEASCSIFVPRHPKGLNWDKKLNLDGYPQASVVRYRFPARGDMPPVKLTWYDGGLMPEWPDEWPQDRKLGDQYGGALYVGDRGKILTGSHGANGLRIIPDAKMAEYRRPAKTLPRSIGHRQEWIAACKGGQAAGANFEYAGPLSELVLLGNIALRFVNQRLEWDPDGFRFPNAPEADQYLHREYRQGWSL